MLAGAKKKNNNNNNNNNSNNNHNSGAALFVTVRYSLCLCFYFVFLSSYCLVSPFMACAWYSHVVAVLLVCLSFVLSLLFGLISVLSLCGLFHSVYVGHRPLARHACIGLYISVNLFLFAAILSRHDPVGTVVVSFRSTLVCLKLYRSISAYFARLFQIFSTHHVAFSVACLGFISNRQQGEWHLFSLSFYQATTS